MRGSKFPEGGPTWCDIERASAFQTPKQSADRPIDQSGRSTDHAPDHGLEERSTSGEHARPNDDGASVRGRQGEDGESHEPTNNCLDPLVRALSNVTHHQPSAPPPLAHSATLDRVAQQLVRRVGLGAGSVHLEFGSGVFEDGKLLVRATDDGLEIVLDTPAGIDVHTLREALTQRLERKGVKVSVLEVT